MKRLAVIIFSIAASVTPNATSAQSCSGLRSYIEDARSNLNRAGRASDFDSAKNYARRAKNDLEEAETAANSCRCGSSASEFDDAARHARRARDADTPDDFADELRRAIRDFNAALGNLQRCAGFR